MTASQPILQSVPSSPGNPRGWLRKRVVIPVGFVAVVAALMVWAGIRGTWTDAQPRVPANAAEGTISQLILNAEGRTEIHAAIVVRAAPERVWRWVTNYNHFSELFRYVGTSKGVREPDGRWRLTGEVRSWIGRWPLDVHVRHTETPGRLAASWDEPSGRWTVNRGSWVITPRGNGESVLEYHLEIKVSRFPDFIVRAVLLDELKPVLASVARRASAP